MARLAVSRTVYPDGKVEIYTNGMVLKKYVAKNTIKQGGVCLAWAMEKTLEKAKEVFTRW